MEIVFDVPAERVAFMLEMLESISYVRNPRPRRARVRKSAAAPEEMDTTQYLLSSPTNAESIRRSIEQLDRGKYIQVELQGDLSLPALPVQAV